MKKERVEKAIRIINYAIKNKISVREASVLCDQSDTYVKNTKAQILDLYQKGILKDELYFQFMKVYDQYSLSRAGGDEPKGYRHQIQKEFLNLKVKPDDLLPTTKGEQTTFNANENQAEIEWKSGMNYPADHIKTLDELLKICQVDLNLWKVRNYLVNKWDVTSWKGNFPETIQNFQVKARLEKNIQIEETLDVVQIFKEMVEKYKPPILNVQSHVPSQSDENNLLEISIFDLHLGKLGWGGETGENYDVKIAHERFLIAIEKLVYRASGFPYSRILFPIGNDFFNSDTIFNTTTKGTQQDEDLRWQKTFKIGVTLIIDAINLLKQTGVPVDIIVIPGNHDFERSFYMGEYLFAWFKDDKMVNVNDGASPRKYYRFGNVLLGFTHGSEEKEGSLPLIMASDIESKPMWSETKFHEWHVGHIHRKRNVNYSTGDNKLKTLNEDLGVTVRYLSSLTGTEEWHHKKGFVGAIKAADAFIWNDIFGLVAHLNTNLIIE
jgi:hypothetical protein